MTAQQILSKLQYPEHLIPTNAAEIVEVMLQSKQLGYSLMDKLEATMKCRNGFFLAVKAVIKDERAAINCVSINHADARANRVLKITNSDGKRIARRMN